EEIEIVRDIGEILLIGLSSRTGIRYRVHAIGLGAIQISGRQAVGPDHCPGGGGGLARYRGSGLFRIYTFLWGNSEQRDDVGVLRLVVRLPIAHPLVRNNSSLVALF